MFYENKHNIYLRLEVHRENEHLKDIWRQYKYLVHGSLSKGALAFKTLSKVNITTGNCIMRGEGAGLLSQNVLVIVRGEDLRSPSMKRTWRYVKNSQRNVWLKSSVYKFLWISTEKSRTLVCGGRSSALSPHYRIAFVNNNYKSAKHLRCNSCSMHVQNSTCLLSFPISSVKYGILQHFYHQI